MSKSKQQQKEVEIPQEVEIPEEEQFLFAIGTPDGDMVLKIGLDGNITYFKEGVTLTEASRAFWNAFQLVLPVTQEDIDAYPNDAELGASIRLRMDKKLNSN